MISSGSPSTPGVSRARTLCLSPHNAEMFLKKTWRTKGFSYLKSSPMSFLTLSDSLEYLCYESTAIRNIVILSVRGSSSYVRI